MRCGHYSRDGYKDSLSLDIYPRFNFKGRTALGNGRSDRRICLSHGSSEALGDSLGSGELFFAIYSAFVSTTFLGANLGNPADTVLHLAVGIWALWAGMQKMTIMMKS